MQSSELSAVASRIEARGRAGHPDEYAGVEIDEDRGLVIVYRREGRGIDAMIREEAGGVPVDLRGARYAEAELLGWLNQLNAALPTWTAATVPISTIGARHTGEGIEIGTWDPEATRAFLGGHYGEDVPFIYVEQPRPRPLG